MKQDFTLHTHTKPFDGQDDEYAMIKAAKQNGMKTIGFSNHFIVHPDICKTDFYPFAVFGGYQSIYNSNFEDALFYFKKHYDILEQYAAQNSQDNIQILRGMEMDLFDTRRWYNGYMHTINTLKPDYIIGSAHLIEYGKKLCNIHDIKKAPADVQDKMLMAYWKKVQWLAKSGMCSCLAHIDLPARVNLGTDEKWAEVEQQTVDIIAENKIPVEINTAAYKKSVFPHPLPRIMKMCADKKVPMFLSDDAHKASQVCRDFDKAKKYADCFGVKLVSLDKVL
ncbi:MAG: hypothetical protein IKZ34_00025 [Alphaproteobacteria bacterium]|nr:hypothetical protein [Alphaproteobacteria bacterium]